MWKSLVVLCFAIASASAWMSECGQSKYEDAGREGPDEFIVGGWDARPGEFPYQLSFHSFESHMCGAILINQDWVLTAAHCTEDEPLFALSVLLGTNDDSGASGTRILIESVHDHPDYDTDAISDDISLMRLEQRATLTPDIQPGCKPASRDHTDEMATVSGWGTLFSDGPYPDTLQYTNVGILDDDFCDDSLPGEIYPGMMCAGRRDGDNVRDSCQGDSGGPLAVKDANTGRFSMVGIVSWGRGCADITPGVYANVTYYDSWITSIIGSELQ